MSDGFKLKVYAYYYPWYDGPLDPRWGTLHEYSPRLGFYNSGDEAVVRRHVEWAIEYGIDGFLVEWFGRDTDEPRIDYDQPEKADANLAVLRDVLLDYPELEFCVFYDQAIRYKAGGGQFLFTEPEMRAAFHADMSYIAETNYSHPNYMRIRNRPVVVLYLTRRAKYDDGAVLNEARDLMEAYGYGRTYFVGDEIWWGEKTYRFNQLDAVTAYNLHNHKWLYIVDGTVREYAAETAGLYSRVQPAANTLGCDLIPNIGHAYNDEFLRGNLPLINTTEPGSLPEHRQDMIECIKAQSIVWQDNSLFRQFGDAYLFVTSFNEWPERSVVEPTAEVETFNRQWDFRYNRHLYLQPHRFGFLEGIKEGKRIMEEDILPTL